MISFRAGHDYEQLALRISSGRKQRSDMTPIKSPSTFTLEGAKWVMPIVTWSFADLSQPNSATFSSAIGAAYQMLFRQAVQHWNDQVDATFREVPDSTENVDIRFGWAKFGIGNQIGEEDYSYSAGKPQQFLPGATVRVEDPSQLPLSTATGIPVYQGTQSSLYQVILHEFGHALGLGHDSNPTTVMYGAASALNRDLSQTDLDGVHALYAPRSSPALFDANFYLTQNPGLAAAAVAPYSDYLESGWKAGRNPSALFDTNYYLAQNPDVRAAGVDPLQHFAKYGWREGRDPSLLFSDSKYLGKNPDVQAAGINPLQHYLSNGQFEQRMTFLSGGVATADPLVDASFYDKQLGATLIPIGVAAQKQAAASYDATGWQAGKNPDAWFDTAYYIQHNQGVTAAQLNPLLHYEKYGWKEGRDPSAQFSTHKYLGAYPDVKAAGMDPLLHYIQYGQGEGRMAFSV